MLFRSLQYFFGGLDVIGDLTLFFLVLLGASVVTALSIATSGQPALARGLLVALVMYLAIVTAGIGMSWGSGLIAPALWTATCLVAAILTAVFLEYAAAGIAPAAENHAGRIRALVLVACLLALVFVRLGGAVSVEALTAFAALLALGVTAAEFTTDSVPVASVHARFARFGPLGRVAALFLAPGWATAIPFVLLASAILLTVFAATRVFTSEFDAWSLYFLALAVASIAFPLPAMLHFPPGQRRWWAFVLVCVASTAIHAIAAAWLRDPYSGRAIGSDQAAAQPKGRVLGNVLIAAGTLVLSASGSLAGRLGKDRSFTVTLLVGIAVLFAGFLVASPRQSTVQASGSSLGQS